MAGYFSKLNGSVYTGEYVAAENLTNGMFVELNSNGKLAPLAAKNTNVTLVVVEKTDLWGLPALRLRVSGTDGKVFFVEQDFSTSEVGEYDEAVNVIKADELTKARTPAIGDEIVMSVSDTIYSAAVVHAIYNADAGGSIAVVQ